MATTKGIIVAEKVMPYRCALYRSLACHSGVDWTVLFLDRWGYEQRYDPTMNAAYSWGDEALFGFKYKFLDNRGRFSVTYTGADKTLDEQWQGALGTLRFYIRTYFGLFTPSIMKEIWVSDCSVVIVEGYSSISSVAAALVARMRGKKVFLRGEATLRSGQSWVVRVCKRLYLRALFPIYSGFMYSCAANKSFYIAYGASSEKLTFVPSAVDDTVFGDIDEAARATVRQVLRERYGIPEEAVVVLGVGRLVTRKNWAEAIHAFLLARHQCENLILVLVGDGPSRTQLESRVTEDLRDAVRFLGFGSQAEVAALYCLGDMLVQSSTYDPSPKVLNEAILAGLPLIVSNCVGTAGDVCVDGENGFVYISGNVGSLSEKILRLATDRELRQRFADRSVGLSKIWSIDAGARNIIEAVKRAK